MLVIPVVGLVTQEIWTLSSLAVDGTGSRHWHSVLGWAAWVASPFAVAAATMMGAARRQNRAAWWTAVAAGTAAVLQGWLLIALAAADPSTDPLVGLYQVLAPLIQLGTAAAGAVAVLVLVILADRQTATRRPDADAAATSA